eukprot:Amastigsp_a8733_4.p4 type:complete len:127 gc:universal Amastigsp_a8733_4:457-77(-)
MVYRCTAMRAAVPRTPATAAATLSWSTSGRAENSGSQRHTAHTNDAMPPERHHELRSERRTTPVRPRTTSTTESSPMGKSESTSALCVRHHRRRMLRIISFGRGIVTVSVMPRSEYRSCTGRAPKP